MKKNHEVCGNKRRFWSQVEADIKADRVGRKFKKQFRTYRCPTCEGWHLTSVKEKS